MRGLKFRGRPPVNFAGSVKDVIQFNNRYAATIMDRSETIDEDFVNAIVGQSVLSWEGRNPSPALDEDGNFIGTDLDLLSFLAPLSVRGAVIEFPKYQALRAGVRRENERRVGTDSRFGPVVGLTSNQDYFSFSVRMVDNSVIVTDMVTGREKVGAFRNFMLVGPRGDWHEGWKTIVFNPSAEVNAFLTDKGLWTDNKVYFKYAVHPNRWQSLFGAPYLLLKMLMARLTDEYKYYNGLVQELEKAGFKRQKEETFVSGESSGAREEKIEIESFEAHLDLPKLQGEFPKVERSDAGLTAAYERAKAIRYTLKPRAQVIVRADELAYYHYGNGRVASWMQNRSFRDFTPPRGKIVWQQMPLSNDVGLRYRLRKVTDTVVTRFAA